MRSGTKNSTRAQEGVQKPRTLNKSLDKEKKIFVSGKSSKRENKRTSTLNKDHKKIHSLKTEKEARLKRGGLVH